MMRKIINVVKYLFFLGLGVFLFWLSYKDLPFKDIVNAFKEVNYFWIFISLLFSVLSLVSRAMRWQLLITASGSKTRFTNVFLSCFILYLVNLLVPRAGEVARCTVVSSTEKVPFAKLVGTMVVERLADMLMLILIAVVVIPLRLFDFKMIFSSNAELSNNFQNLFSTRNILLGIGAGLLFLVLIFYFFKKVKSSNSKIAKKVNAILKTIREGIYSILSLDRKWEFIAHTIFIFLMWLAMLYVVFLAFKPTSGLSIMAGIVTFFMGGLAMLAPINGGIGAWHWMVIISLTGAYGISEFDATIFAFIGHTTTNLIYLVFGIIAVAMLFILNRKNKVQIRTKNPKEL